MVQAAERVAFRSGAIIDNRTGGSACTAHLVAERLLARLPEDLPLLAVDGEGPASSTRQLLGNARRAISDRGIVTVEARLVHLGIDDCLTVGRAQPGLHVEISVSTRVMASTPTSSGDSSMSCFSVPNPAIAALRGHRPWDYSDVWRRHCFGPHPGQERPSACISTARPMTAHSSRLGMLDRANLHGYA